MYGGAFNPITNAHLNVAAEIIHSELADEVWIVPSGPRPDKPALKTSYVACHPGRRAHMSCSFLRLRLLSQSCGPGFLPDRLAPTLPHREYGCSRRLVGTATA